MYYYYYSLVHVTCNITTLLKMCCDYRAPTHCIFHLQFDLYERSSCRNDTVVSVLLLAGVFLSIALILVGVIAGKHFHLYLCSLLSNSPSSVGLAWDFLVLLNLNLNLTKLFSYPSA